MLRNSSRAFLRYQSTSFKRLTSKEEIIKFISTPRIHIHENLIKTITPVEVSDEKLIKVMKLSSLEIPEDLSIYKKPLMTQVGFLSKIHELNPKIYEYNYNQPQEQGLTTGLKLTDIYNNIEQQKPDPSKGEIESKAELLKLSTYTKNNHYIVKEGLLKQK